jgi:hypothetical protein
MAEKKNDLFSKQLAAGKAAWGKNKERSKSAGKINVDKGIYTCVLNAVKSVQVGQEKTLKHIWEWKVKEPSDSAGEMIPIWHDPIDEDKSLFYLRDLRSLGVNVDEMDITDLPEVIADLLKSKVHAKLAVTETADGMYKNAKVLKGVDNDGADEGADAGEDKDKDAGKEEASELKVGDTVKATRGKDSITGEITEIEGDQITVKDSESDEYEFDADECEVLEEEKKAPGLKPKNKKAEAAAAVDKKIKKEKPAPPDEDDTEEEDVDADDDLEIGDEVTFHDLKGKEHTGIFRGVTTEGKQMFRDNTSKEKYELAPEKAKAAKVE